MKRKCISFLTVLVMLIVMIPMQSFAVSDVVQEITAEESAISTVEADGVTTPAALETPGDPALPETPGDPPAPETPVDPTVPETPGDPATPETPGDPAVPETPGDPAVPETPGDPAVPETPDDDAVTETTSDAIVDEIPELMPEIIPLVTADSPISISTIVGVTAPVTGETPVSVIADTAEYKATISWSGDPVTFAASTVYTATITITPLTGYTLTGVPANFFTVAGATATNVVDSGVVTAVFPATAAVAPQLVGATTNESGDTVTLAFDKAMADPSADFSGLAVKVNGWYGYTPVTATMAIKSAALNTDPTKIDLTLDKPLQRGDIATVEYVPGTIASADGGVLEVFAAQPVENIVPVVIDSNLDGTWEAYDHVGWWGEVPYPTGDDWRGHEYNRHIYIDGNEVTFYGNGQMPFVDFLYLANSEAAAKGFTYDLDLVSTDWHTLEGGGFLFNADIDNNALSGYVVLFAYPQDSEAVYSVKLFELDDVDVESMRGNTLSYCEGVTQLASFPVYTAGTKHHLNLETSADTLSVWDGDTQLIANYHLPNEYGNGVGLIGSYFSHGCPSLSYFTFSDLKIQGIANLTAELDGDKAYLNFTKPEGATSVTVEQSTDGVNFTPATLADPIDTSSTTATVTGLTPGQTYYFRLAIDGGKYDGYSRVAITEVLPPELVDAYTNKTGDRITLLFSKEMAEITDPIAAAMNFSVMTVGFNYDESVMLTSTASSIINSDDAKALELKLNTPIQRGDIVGVGYTPGNLAVAGVGYTPGNLAAADGTLLQAFEEQVDTPIPFKFDWSLNKTWDGWSDHVGWYGEGPFLGGDDPRGHEFNRHIVSSGSAVVFYGYGYTETPLRDYIYLDSEKQIADSFSFDVDLSGLKSGMEGGGFLFNTFIGYDEETLIDYLFGYFALFTIKEGVPQVNLYQLDGIKLYEDLVDGGFSFADIPEGITLLGSYPLSEGDKHSIKLQPTKNAVSLWEGSTKLIDNLALPEPYGYGIGVMGCSQTNESEELSYFILSNLTVPTPSTGGGGGGGHSNPAPAPENILEFQIDVDNCDLTSGSAIKQIGMDVAPIIYEGRTLLPIRYVVEPLGGTVLWDETEQKVTITLGKTTIEMWIGNNIAKVNGFGKQIDPLNPNVKPIIVAPGRTMLPLRFISEALGCTVDWDEKTKKITVTDWD